VPQVGSLANVISKLLKNSDLPFKDFVELALYHPLFGYYAQSESPVGKEGDFVTSPLLSPVFADTLGNLIPEFVGRGGDGVSQIMDIGCGDGALIRAIARGFSASAEFFGVDRSLSRVVPQSGVTFVQSLSDVPAGRSRLIISNELFDALPFARLVQRDDHLHELWVTERDGVLDWSEH